jgi:hypothetical protein
LVSEPNFPKKSLLFGETISKVGEEIEVIPPKFDEDGNPVVVEEGSKLGTSKTPTLEDLMKKLDMLKAENKGLKAKGKKGTKYSSFEEEVSNTGERKKQAR